MRHGLDFLEVPRFCKPRDGAAGYKPTTYADGGALGTCIGGCFACQDGLAAQWACQIGLKALKEPLGVSFTCCEQARALGGGVGYAHPCWLMAGHDARQVSGAAY